MLTLAVQALALGRVGRLGGDASGRPVTGLFDEFHQALPCVFPVAFLASESLGKNRDNSLAVGATSGQADQLSFNLSMQSGSVGVKAKLNGRCGFVYVLTAGSRGTNETFLDSFFQGGGQGES